MSMTGFRMQCLKNVAHCHIEYFKLKESEKRQWRDHSLTFPEIVTKSICTTCSIYACKKGAFLFLRQGPWGGIRMILLNFSQLISRAHSLWAYLPNTCNFFNPNIKTYKLTHSSGSSFLSEDFCVAKIYITSRCLLLSY